MGEAGLSPGTDAVRRKKVVSEHVQSAFYVHQHTRVVRCSQVWISVSQGVPSEVPPQLTGDYIITSYFWNGRPHQLPVRGLVRMSTEKYAAHQAVPPVTVCCDTFLVSLLGGRCPEVL